MKSEKQRPVDQRAKHGGLPLGASLASLPGRFLLAQAVGMRCTGDWEKLVNRREQDL
ncbi:MAG: hypothetical protein AAF961_17760 [Planctomycetota bacterium]